MNDNASKKGLFSRRNVVLVIVILLLVGLIFSAVATGLYGLLSNSDAMTINEQNFNLDDYYWQVYITKRALFNTGDILTKTVLQEKIPGTDITREALLRDSVDSALRVSAAVLSMAKEYNVTLTSEDQDSVDKKIAEFVSEIGGRKAYEDFLRNHRTSEAALKRYYETNALLERMEKAVYAEGKPLDLTEGERASAQGHYNEVFARYSYILFLTLDGKGNPLSAAQLEAKQGLAAAAAALASDKANDFNQINRDYGDDASEQNETYMYYIAKNSNLSQELEDAVFNTPVGEVSPLVSLPNGMIIIKRHDLDNGKIEEHYAATRKAKLQTDVGNNAKTYSINYGDAYDSIEIR